MDGRANHWPSNIENISKKGNSTIGNFYRNGKVPLSENGHKKGDKWKMDRMYLLT